MKPKGRKRTVNVVIRKKPIIGKPTRTVFPAKYDPRPMLRNFFRISGLRAVRLNPRELKALAGAMKGVDAVKDPQSTRTSKHHFLTALDVLKEKIGRGEIRDHFTLTKELLEEIGNAKEADLRRTPREKLKDHIARLESDYYAGWAQFFETLKRSQR